nr:MAG TPA: Merozoite Surface Antigen 2 (MSA-2) family [Caudoviricetes sp.]
MCRDMGDEERKEMNKAVAVICFTVVMLYGIFQSCV